MVNAKILGIIIVRTLKGNVMLDQEFPGNVRITISDNEMRIWVCDENGCKFRFKAFGKAIQYNAMDFMIVPKSKPTSQDVRTDHYGIEALASALRAYIKACNCQYGGWEGHIVSQPCDECDKAKALLTEMGETY